MVIDLNDYLVHSCLHSQLGSRFYRLEALGELMGSLEFFFFGLWLSYYVGLVFVCLMQLFSYMLWMKKLSNDFLIGK